MSRQGITLIEVVLALALFSGIFLALADLAATSNQVSRRVPAKRIAAEVERFFLTVERTLLEGDDPMAQDRIESAPGHLSIRGRRGAWRHWTFEPATGQLNESDAGVLTGVRVFDAAVDPETGSLNLQLEIELPRAGINRFERRFALP